MFYAFRQNNSGGNFHGPVIICVECDSTEEANEIAQNHEVYFDGCETGSDCDCCGDRWYRAYSDSELTERPEIYGEFIPDQDRSYKIIYKDGRVLEGGKQER